MGFESISWVQVLEVSDHWDGLVHSIFRGVFKRLRRELILLEKKGEVEYTDLRRMSLNQPEDAGTMFDLSIRPHYAS